MRKNPFFQAFSQVLCGNVNEDYFREHKDSATKQVFFKKV